MLMNMADVYASLSATTFKKASGQRTSLSGPARHRFDLRAASRSFRMLSLSLYNIACRAVDERVREKHYVDEVDAHHR